MDFALSVEQQLLKKISAEWLASRCPKALVRDMESDSRGYLPELWQEMAANGWLGMVVPETYGGSGLSFLDQIVLLEEMGKSCLPGPYVPSAVTVACSLLLAGSEAQKESFLPRISSGELVATLAATEASGLWASDAIEMTATPDGDAFVLDGLKLFVPYAHVSGLLIVAAKTRKGLSLFLVDPQAKGISVSLLDSIARDKLCEIKFDGVRVQSESLLGSDGEGDQVLEQVLQRAALAQCAESVGGAQHVLEMAVGYSKERIQYGRPIGSFQAIQHHCANMAADVETSRYATYYAAWCLAEGIAAVKEVAVAKAWVSEAYRRITILGQQIHGAIGFTAEHDMQLYFRRAKSAEVMYGGASYHRAKVAAQMGL